MSPRRRAFLLSVLAALAIVFAAAVTWATSQLVSQRIGLSSEPPTAGLRLLPPAETTPRRAAPRTSTTGAPRTSGSARTPAPSSVPQTSTAPSRGEPAPAQEPAFAGGEGEHGDSSSRRDD